MRILAVIPHYFDVAGGGASAQTRHGSRAGNPAPRIEALAACLSALHQLYGSGQVIIEIRTKIAQAVNQSLASEVDIVICTTGSRHLLQQLPVPADQFQHHSTNAEPHLLGFECHAALRDRLGAYDYYCYLEDDLVAHDPWLFAKLAWFNSNVGDGSVLQPNRFEVACQGPALKAYLDGEINPDLTRAHQDLNQAPTLRSTVMGVSTAFRRVSNPHSGCFFLNARQMQTWTEQPYFLDRDTGFIGPLESAATLGIMRTFRVYKPAPENASFLEIEHHGTAFISQLRRRGEPQNFAAT